ncbi:MAG TPA: hypothetical protein VFZ25_00705, partial [Chloroflexota bacterium]|nr:hypothetical protein [Chloroflexota bacterium]
DPPRFIAEMARVSRALVLIIVGNTWNVGYPIHAVACRLGHQTSPWGAAAWMALGPIEGVLRRLGLAIVERGMVDMPPWPGFDALSVVGKRVRRARAAGPTDPASDEEIERRLHRLTFIEYAPLPSVLKIPFAHQHYILARKGT